jgi:hypothetical protein
LNVNCRLVESPTFWTPTRFTSSKQKGSHLHSALIARLMHWFLRCYFSLSLQLRPSQVRRLTAAGEYKPFVKLLSSNGTKIAELQTRIQELLKATTRNPQCSRQQTCLLGTLRPRDALADPEFLISVLRHRMYGLILRLFEPNKPPSADNRATIVSSTRDEIWREQL